jgi:polysaccharide deacetylase family protein (PEP-CTERM system associated)
MSDKYNPTHCLTVDVEDYFHVAAFRNCVPAASWDQLPSRVEANTAKVLDLLNELGARATFFVLGWVAERFPSIVRRISQAGHELGCHSYSHQLIYDLDPKAFHQDTVRALDAIQQASGERVSSYRAPSFSITRRSLWALDVLASLGITHDSSIFPVRHDLYGIPQAPAAPFVIQLAGARMVEFPASTIRLFGTRLPATGGGYLRILPLLYQRKALRTLEHLSIPGMIYLHPWELDPEQPRIKSSLRSHFRHYTGLSRTASRMRKLSGQFHFAPMSEALPAELPVFEIEKNGKFCPCRGETTSGSLKRPKEVRERANACL